MTWRRARRRTCRLPSPSAPFAGLPTQPQATLLVAADTPDDESLAALLRAARSDLLQARKSQQTSPIGSLLVRLESDPHIGEVTPEMLDILIDVALERVRRRKLRARLLVDRLELSNFRGIRSLDIDFPRQGVTVLAGPNGAGKSSVLDAIALILSQLTARLENKPKAARFLTDNDVRNQQPTGRITAQGALSGVPISCSLARTRDLGPLFSAKEDNDVSGLNDGLETLRKNLGTGDICLPVVAKYPVHRAVLDIPLRIRTSHVFDPIDVYEGAYERTGRNFRLFFEWFRNREDLENQWRAKVSHHRDHQLEAVRRALVLVIPEISEPRVNRSPLALIVDKGGVPLYVDQLSDGEKGLMAMVGDLARRLAMANPFADDPLEGGGVVLIDEVELHLHPGWQRRLIPALERTFPHCQFVLSTHSPAVLSHVHRDAVLLLRSTDAGITLTRPDVSKGADVGRILEDLLDVPARPPEFQERISGLFKKIDAGETEAARSLYSELVEVLGPHDPDLVRALVLLRRRERSAP